MFVKLRISVFSSLTSQISLSQKKLNLDGIFCSINNLLKYTCFGSTHPGSLRVICKKLYLNNNKKMLKFKKIKISNLKKKVICQHLGEKPEPPFSASPGQVLASVHCFTDGNLLSAERERERERERAESGDEYRSHQKR